MNVFSYKLLALILLFSSCSLREEAVVEFLPDYKGEWSTPPSNTPTNKVPDGEMVISEWC